MAASSRQRAYAGITAQLAGVSIAVDLVPVRNPGVNDRLSTRRLCGKCPTPHTLSQFYRGDCGAEYTDGELNAIGRRAVEADTDSGTTLVELDADELAAAVASSVDDATIQLEVRARDDVEASMLPDGSLYRMRPKKKKGETSLKTYALLRDLATNAKHALIGRAVVHGDEKLYRLIVWHGMIVMQGMIRPDDVAEFEDVPETEYDGAELVAALELLKRLSKPVADGDFHDERADRLQVLVAHRLADPGKVKPLPAGATAPANDGGSDLLAALEASVAVVQNGEAASAA